MKILTKVSSLLEAEMIVAKLQAFGVEAEIPDRITVSNLPYLTPMLGGIRILVPAEKLIIAEEILAQQIPESEIDAELQEYEGGCEICPHCGSAAVGLHVPSHTLFDAVLSFAMGALFVIRSPRMQCSKCHTVWRTNQVSRAAKIGEITLVTIGIIVFVVSIYLVLRA
jgi:hypothetical protein